MSLWLEFKDWICAGRNERAEPETSPAVALDDDEFIARHVEMRRKAEHGKLWKRDGDKLHLTDFPIAIRRATLDEEMTKGGAFCVECKTMMPRFLWTLDDAKFVGERWAKEIDALPLTPDHD